MLRRLRGALAPISVLLAPTAALFESPTTHDPPNPAQAREVVTPKPSAAPDSSDRSEFHPSGGEATDVRVSKPFAVYTKTGEHVRLRQIVEAMHDVDVLLVGEYHDDPIAHVAEFQLLLEAHREYSDRSR